MKTAVPPRMRYRPPAHWPLYLQWDQYDPAHPHKWIRQGEETLDESTFYLCVQCGEIWEAEPA